MDKYSSIINSEKFSKLSLNTTTYSKSLIHWENLLNYLIVVASPINKTIDKNTLQLIRSTYEAMLLNFPYLENYHIDFALFEYKLGHLSRFHKIFKNALHIHNKRSLVLWVSYLRTCNEIVIDQKQLFKKYEDAEQYIGLHYHSGVFWEMYLEQLKQRCQTKQRYFIVLRKVLEIPLHSFSTFYALWMNYIDEIKDLSELTLFINKDDLSKKLKIDRDHSGRRGPYLRDAKKAIKKFTKELYMVIQLQVMERYNLFESKLSTQYYTTAENLVSDNEIRTWLKYLDYTIELGIPELCYINFQRALIALSNTDIIWIKYAYWLIDIVENTTMAKIILMRGMELSLEKIKIIHILCTLLISLDEMHTLDNLLQGLNLLYENDIESCKDFKLFWDYIQFQIFIANSAALSRYEQTPSKVIPDYLLKKIQKRLIANGKRDDKNSMITHLMSLQSKKNLSFIEKEIFKYVVENCQDDYLNEGLFWQSYCNLILLDTDRPLDQRRDQIVKNIWPQIPRNEETLDVVKEFARIYFPQYIDQLNM
ncbi:similar to Saccharomyces cerevisiae YDR235W PRP42 U1 snRNP protein involved in splicing, required for U1 snRNP biogenesis [Maudiozyma barnettii]|uniref:Similar to Saccharomyces cerevisiae YDR235W PRP42 U1 snRNP protein involved in splicing, required for U1 snRNP biogenesis n=1 Tax=Maudiozyma barnettii TaxID=61262 RepID=A0A8H2VGJ8_9SACH|nr:mRNA splicing protein PRP42 [Kazachstania barnettii]CAB4255036.1 similar to Saccharomyces cerevisiae YDR235W PRP42 U1 snRNP protein involved in splicing, required for U1 snRNP biogenesis [Kazachstania barnettii]CAD1783307.1 similar to Saccharomyces cerevisiae YDR235W PRP42 U1 snRNP protein involved in splicing, required for U1 snRNP biogenesis [Kazachstania barnettii]